MIRYIIRRLLIGVLILMIVCALTFVFFRVLPTGNPALLRAGRDPQTKSHQGDRRRPRAQQTPDRAVLGLHEGILPALQPRLQLLQPGVGQGADRRTAARHALAHGRRGGAVGARRPQRRDHLGPASSLDRRPPVDGHGAAAALGPGILARLRDAAAVRQRHRQIQDPAGSRQLRGAHIRPVEVVHLADHAVDRASRRLGRRVSRG